MPSVTYKLTVDFLTPGATLRIPVFNIHGAKRGEESFCVPGQESFSRLITLEHGETLGQPSCDGRYRGKIELMQPGNGGAVDPSEYWRQAAESIAEGAASLRTQLSRSERRCQYLAGAAVAGWVLVAVLAGVFL